MAWPYPRVIQTEWHTFYVVSDRLCTLTWADAEYWIVEPLVELPPLDTIAQIDIADYGPFYVVCLLLHDHTARMLAHFPADGWREFDEHICGVGCAFNGQFVGGFTGVEREIVWTAIGNFEFDPGVDRTAGFRSLFFPGSARRNIHVLRLLPLGTRIIAYANNGRVLLTPSVVQNTFAYGMETLYGLGVRSGNHVAGDVRIHGYIDVYGDFWTLDSANEHTKRGYREFIRALDLSRTVVSYTPIDQRFYISDGARCFCINAFGAFEQNECVSSLFTRFDGAVAATAVTTGDTHARITSEWLDFGSRGLKSVESLLASVNNPLNAETFLTVDYRMRKNDPHQRFRLITGGPTAEAGIHVTALDFRLHVDITDFHAVEVDSLMANVKYSDQRFKRGTVPEQYNTARQGL